MLLSAPQAGAQAVFFTDVERGSWYASFVERAATLGIVGGYTLANGAPTGKFGPADPVTVSQALKMEVGAAGIDASAYALSENRGAGVPACDEWWCLYFRIAEAQGASITHCFAQRAQQPIRRWEMARLMADVHGLGAEPQAALPNPYSDLNVTVALLPGVIPVPAKDTPEEWNKLEFTLERQQNEDAILILTRDGVLTGDQPANAASARAFRPFDTLTRAEAVKILLRATDTYGTGESPAKHALPAEWPLPCTA